MNTDAINPAMMGVSEVSISGVFSWTLVDVVMLVLSEIEISNKRYWQFVC